MTRIARFFRRWKYTTTAIVVIIIPSVVMLFFPLTRKLGIAALVIFFVAFIRERVKWIR